MSRPTPTFNPAHSPFPINHPPTEHALLAVQNARKNRKPISPQGASTKQNFGAPVNAQPFIPKIINNGIGEYQPSETVIGVDAAVPMNVLLQTIHEQNQTLACDPPNLAAFYGNPLKQPTLGGTLGVGFAGPARPFAGSLADALLGALAVSGHGAVVRAGGRMVKNVTGYNVARFLTGSLGTLAVITHAFLRTHPLPQAHASLLFPASLPDAVALLRRAAKAPLRVAAASFIPAPIAALLPTTTHIDHVAVHLHGSQESVKQDVNDAPQILKTNDAPNVLQDNDAVALQRCLRDLIPFTKQQPPYAVWRIPCRPAHAVQLVQELQSLPNALWWLDWAGSLLMLAAPENPNSPDPAHSQIVRQAAQNALGHATLMRASLQTRIITPTHHPQPTHKTRLLQNLKNAFDPLDVLNPGKVLPAS